MPCVIGISLVLLGMGPSGCSPQSVAQGQPVSPELSCDPNIFVNLAKKVVPSVVNISSSATVKSPFFQGGPDESFRRFFEEFFGYGGRYDDEDRPRKKGEPRPNPRPNPRSLPKSTSLGTGFVIDASGLILTNNHVVAEADEIKISFTESPDEMPTDGEVVGRDAELDVALIRVKTSRQLVPLILGDSDGLQVGEYVMAVGNPFGQGHSATHGIISAKGRVMPGMPMATYLQTDAPINPGNSGGPLVNLKGEVIGVNNAIDARAQGIGFAIPSNAVVKILPQLKTKGSVSRGYLGAVIGDVTPELAEKLGIPKDTRAPFVTSVAPGGPADKAGIKPYDVILEVDGKRMRSSSDLVGTVTSLAVDSVVPVKLSREGKEKSLRVKLGKRPTGEESPEQIQGRPEKKGKKKPEAQPRIDTGMELTDLTAELRQELGIRDAMKGVVVSSLEYGSPADKAGLSRGDVILEVDRKPVISVEGFYSVVKEKKSYLLRVRKVPESREPGGPDGGGAGRLQDVYSVVILDLKQ